MNKSKALRIIIDAMIMGVVLIGSSRNLALVKTNLERSKMFLGQVLKEQGEENPYPSSKDSSNAKIEPTADTSDDENELLVSLKKIRDENKPGIALTVKQIKEMRSFMDDTVSELRELIDNHDDADYELMWKKEALIAFIEAQQWLGMELGAINDSLNGKEQVSPSAQPGTTSDLPESNTTTSEHLSAMNAERKDDDDPSGDRA